MHVYISALKQNKAKGKEQETDWFELVGMNGELGKSAY